MRPQVPSTREANSYFEGKMASTTRFGEEKSIDTDFCQWSLHSIFTSKDFNHVPSPDSVFISYETSEQPSGSLVTE